MEFHRSTKILLVFLIFEVDLWVVLVVISYAIVPLLSWLRSLTTAFRIIQYLLSKVLIFVLLEDLVGAALLSDENVEVPLFPLDEEDEAVETHALHNIDDDFDHTRIETAAIAKCNNPPVFPLLILPSTILLRAIPLFWCLQPLEMYSTTDSGKVVICFSKRTFMNGTNAE